jgi:hypothetical protein
MRRLSPAAAGLAPLAMRVRAWISNRLSAFRRSHVGRLGSDATIVCGYVPDPETELSGSARTLCRRKSVEFLVRLSRNRATAGRFGEAARLLTKAFNTDIAHGLRTMAAEYGRMPKLALRKIRPEPTPSPSVAFPDLDPMDVTRPA